MLFPLFGPMHTRNGRSGSKPSVQSMHDPPAPHSASSRQACTDPPVPQAAPQPEAGRQISIQATQQSWPEGQSAAPSHVLLDAA